ncbi:hypothetical protein [Mesorhizobium retamae]|uniref:Nuclear transport factor 2 family protein n=1 Tax=Mesorhizobium retamae TaxID=2912854 RepID=A0ABS9QNP3_9HYPH|nr:hypothetical protein [Mesorhizobium sp. IRAMC:0171]MCG7509063.1 hypothetical protein [Mesorhizobium sp. IRAMC:0171]
MKRLLVAALAVLLLSSPVFAQSAADMNKSFDQLFGAHKPYAEFFAKLQAAIAAGDKATVAGLVDYPFQARIGDKAIKVRDAAHFIADYDRVITAKVKAAVAKQTYATLFANWQGVMIGDGEIWFSGIGDGKQVKIIAIND